MKGGNRKYHFVYLTTNLLNGKIYIGKHSTDFLDDGYLGSNKELLEDISLFGRENFKREILEFFETIELAFEGEAKYADKDFVEREDTYNRYTGGFSNRTCCEETREIMRNIDHWWQDKINKNPEKIAKMAEKHRGMKRSEQARVNMSNAAKRKFANGYKNWTEGKKLCYLINTATKERKRVVKDSEKHFDLLSQGFVEGFKL